MSSDLRECIGVLIITYNEAPNIDRTLSKLQWAHRIVIVDSGSNDGTQRIVGQHRNAHIVHHPFDSFDAQCNFGLGHSMLDSEWVLSLDADYVLSDALVEELGRLRPPADIAGYRARFEYAIFGQTIRGGVYPPVVVLFRKKGARYVADGHAHRVLVDGGVGELSGCIYHDDRKPLSRWLDSQRSYARHEADHIARSSGAMRWQDRIRTLIGVAPVFMFVYVYLIRGAILDGRQGLYYALQRAYAELLLSIELLDRRLRGGSGD
jgi:glycosyltransferase involved in cell wall biosynthesis